MASASEWMPACAGMTVLPIAGLRLKLTLLHWMPAGVYPVLRYGAEMMAAEDSEPVRFIGYEQRNEFRSSGILFVPPDPAQ